MLYNRLAFLKGQFITIILFFVLIKLAIHLPFNGRYGFHADELLYLAMSDDLAWGYKEGPPFIAGIVWFSVQLFGDSLWALRLIPTLCGASVVLLTGLLTAKMGGGKVAVLVTCTALLFDPSFLATAYMMQPVVFDQLFWLLSVFLLIKYIQSQNSRNLIYLGLVVGIGMMNKVTIGLYLLTLIFALLLSPQRKLLFNRYWLYAAGISLLIFLPHLIWQVIHHFPIIQQFNELRTNYWSHTSTLQLVKQLFLAHGASGSVCFAGLLFLFLSPECRSYRFIALGFVFLQIVLLLIQGKTYYSFGAFPVLFAVGGICYEQLFLMYKKPALRHAFFSMLVILGLISIPAAVPVLSLRNTVLYFESMKKYSGIQLPLKWDDGTYHTLTQYYGQMLGWELLAKETAFLYQSLPENQQITTVIVTDNYQQAGAISHFGKMYQFPPSVSRMPSFFSHGIVKRLPEYIIQVTSKGKPVLFDHTQLIAQQKITEPHSEIDGATIYLLRIRRGYTQ
ncbi:glycosyl transferase, family 39 [Arcticibacter svalbardensis MN12-7]|uniref:Glycosyl transferase, family 39 n=1 Tax=Arcticibacter svalbardensis MN12-7 TaxID=1150600 RepID=R9GM69_9SPHI|nr:glycosyltransferase family 39 protein [Arcticibacter svalbardensis]EOR92932.1 glycosyl transferase, family 39 [Arcticibacter svalbardensis MN12-7]